MKRKNKIFPHSLLLVGIKKKGRSHIDRKQNDKSGTKRDKKKKRKHRKRNQFKITKKKSQDKLIERKISMTIFLSESCES